MKRLNREANYEFWDRRQELTEHQVVYLWCGLEPPLHYRPTEQLRVIQEQLLQAKMDGLVKWRLEVTDVGNGDRDYEIWYRRQDLVDYAELMGEEPAFLFPDTRFSPKPQAINELHRAGGVCHNERSTSADASKLDRSVALYGSGLLTVKQFCQKYPEFTPGSLRYHIWRSRPQRDKTGASLPPNGLEPAVMHKGRTVRLDERLFMAWWRKHGNEAADMIAVRDNSAP